MGGAANPGLRARLSAMMAGVYAVQGAWWPLLAVHLADLKISGRTRGWIFATLAIASLLTPLIVSQIADRRVATQRLLAAIYAGGTGLLALMAAGLVTSGRGLFALFLAYWLLTAPAIGLSSAMAFRNLERPAEQFGGVRLWGTVGWMAIGWAVSGLMTVCATITPGSGVSDAFAVAALLSVLMAGYCLTLPHTPSLARAAGRRALDLGTARALVRRPGVGLFLALAFGVSLTTPYVYQVVPAHLAERGLPRPAISAAMSLGQVLEIGVLIGLPRIIGRLVYRATLGLGIAAWVAYFGWLAARPAVPIGLIGLPLQGLAIALFHITGPMYLDRSSSPELRSSTQGLYVAVTTGIGMLCGSLLAGEVVTRLGDRSSAIFLVPLAIDAALLGCLRVAFRDPSRDESPA